MNQDGFKRYMSFSRSERIAIITIVSAIVAMMIAKYLLIKIPPKRDYYTHDLDSIIARREAVIDSINKIDSIAKAEKKAKYSKRFTQKNKQTEKKEDSAKPSKHKKQDKAELSFPIENKKDSTTFASQQIIDFNTADTTLLKQLPGIGPVFAQRIVEYRERLGFYVVPEQLLEVYGMDSARYAMFKNQITFDTSYQANKLKVNTDAFKVLLRHPYLNYDDVKKIVSHRERKGLISSWQQLHGIVGDEINPNLKYYIDYQ